MSRVNQSSEFQRITRICFTLTPSFVCCGPSLVLTACSNGGRCSGRDLCWTTWKTFESSMDSTRLNLRCYSFRLLTKEL